MKLNLNLIIVLLQGTLVQGKRGMQRQISSDGELDDISNESMGSDSRWIPLRGSHSEDTEPFQNSSPSPIQVNSNSNLLPPLSMEGNLPGSTENGNVLTWNPALNSFVSAPVSSPAVAPPAMAPAASPAPATVPADSSVLATAPVASPAPAAAPAASPAAAPVAPPAVGPMTNTMGFPLGYPGTVPMIAPEAAPMASPMASPVTPPVANPLAPTGTNPENSPFINNDATPVSPPSVFPTANNNIGMNPANAPLYKPFTAVVTYTIPALNHPLANPTAIPPLNSPFNPNSFGYPTSSVDPTVVVPTPSSPVFIWVPTSEYDPATSPNSDFRPRFRSSSRSMRRSSISSFRPSHTGFDMTDEFNGSSLSSSASLIWLATSLLVITLMN